MPYSFRFYGTVAFGALLLLIPAFLNGYPIFNPDVATYLASGFKPDTPFDRPITYGLLLRAMSINGISLWLAALIQSWWVSWLIVKTTRVVLPGKYFLAQALTILSFLSVCTSLSWVTSELIPDIYTSLAVLCIVLILAGREGKKDTVLLYVLYTIAIATHMAHLVLFTLLLLLIMLLRKWMLPTEVFGKTVRKITMLIVLTISCVATMGSALSKSRHVFFMGAMLEQGILKEYLAEHCAAKNYKICAYKDDLPARADDFLWNEANSPLYKTGGWAANKEEYNDIISGTLTQPKYIGLHITASLRMSLRQAITFRIGDGNVAFPAGSGVEQATMAYVPNDHKRFSAARQQQHLLLPLIKYPNVGFAFIVVLSLLTLIVLLGARWKTFNPYMKMFLVSGILSLVLNVWDCATFAQVNGRYGCKMIWLIPFMAVLCVFQRGNAACAKPI